MKIKTYNLFTDLLTARKKGFSLIEMVVTTALVAIITVVVSTFLVQSIKTYRIKRQSIDLEEKAAQVMRDFERNTRAASKIIKADGNELVFLRYFDLTSASPTQVRYFVSGNKLEVGLTEPFGPEPDVTYPSSNEKIDLIIQDVTNPNTLFTYFNGSSDQLNLPLNATDIRMVGFSISLDKNGNLPPAAITESTEISLRNMKDNL